MVAVKSGSGWDLFLIDFKILNTDLNSPSNLSRRCYNFYILSIHKKIILFNILIIKNKKYYFDVIESAALLQALKKYCASTVTNCIIHNKHGKKSLQNTIIIHRSNTSIRAWNPHSQYALGTLRKWLSPSSVPLSHTAARSLIYVLFFINPIVFFDLRIDWKRFKKVLELVIFWP